MKIPAEVLAVARQLSDLRERVVFVGGMVRGLLVTDPAVDGPRPTRDVDVILDVKSQAEFAETEATLRKLGFRHDLSEDAPICRYVLRGAGSSGEDVPVDFMPVDPAILGFSNVWYPDAYATALRLNTAAGIVCVIDAPHFFATKLESFASRGGGDYYHHDLEDLVVLVDGRPELIDELSRAHADLQSFVAEEIAGLLADTRFRDALPGHLSSDAASQGRLPLLLAHLARIANLVSAAPPVDARPVESALAPVQPRHIAPYPTRATEPRNASAAERALSWRPMRSSNIEAFSYEPVSRVLTVQFVRGRTYAYKDVPREIFEGFKGAASAGRYFNRWIKGRYRFRKVS